MDLHNEGSSIGVLPTLIDITSCYPVFTENSSLSYKVIL